MIKFGLIGKTLSHSFSKKYFEYKFKMENIDAIYLNLEFDKIRNIKSYLNKRDFLGLNVTIPYKEKIIPFLDELSDEAKQIGAVNTILNKNNQLIGYNTDVFGFHQSIKPYFQSHHKRAIILGTGGASKAVDFVLKKIGCQTIFISRNPQKKNQFHYKDINSYMLNSYKLIVNCTPVGSFPNVNQMPYFPTKFLDKDHLVVDLIYNPLETKLIKEAIKQNCTVQNGLVMLREQAEKSWQIWNN